MASGGAVAAFRSRLVVRHQRLPGPERRRLAAVPARLRARAGTPSAPACAGGPTPSCRSPAGTGSGGRRGRAGRPARPKQADRPGGQRSTPAPGYSWSAAPGGSERGTTANDGNDAVVGGHTHAVSPRDRHGSRVDGQPARGSRWAPSSSTLRCGTAAAATLTTTDAPQPTAGNRVRHAVVDPLGGDERVTASVVGAILADQGWRGTSPG